VLTFIAKRKVSNTMKQGLGYAYHKYCDYYKINTEIPLYKPEPKPKRIPLNEKLEILIGHATRKNGVQTVIKQRKRLTTNRTA
jgi:hypothetical protein